MGPLLYHTSHVPGLLFWLRANAIANLVCARVADHKLAAEDLLELLTDYQITSSRLAILVIRILMTLLALAAMHGYHCRDAWLPLRRDQQACALRTSHSNGRQGRCASRTTSTPCHQWYCLFGVN